MGSGCLLHGGDGMMLKCIVRMQVGMGMTVAGTLSDVYNYSSLCSLLVCKYACMQYLGNIIFNQ